MRIGTSMLSVIDRQHGGLTSQKALAARGLQTLEKVTIQNRSSKQAQSFGQKNSG